MRKKIILLPLAMSLAVSVFAQSFNQGGFYYEVNSVQDKTLSLVKAESDSCSGVVALPGSVTYNGVDYKISDIKDRAFSGCDGMTSIIIPESVIRIGVNAFDKCPNIESVYAASPVTAEILLSNPFVLDGSHVSGGSNSTVNYVFNQELGRNVTMISGNETSPWRWSCDFSMADVSLPAGSYKASLGIVPSADSLSIYFHPIVYTSTSNGRLDLYDPIHYDTIRDSRGRMRLVASAEYFTNDHSKYDLISFKDALEIPEDNHDLSIELGLNYDERIKDNFSDVIIFDRLILEPIDTVFALESYAGPFVESVFNNATLYVPEGAVDTYGSADGWKLFSNIASAANAPEEITSVRKVEAPAESQETIIYDLNGRRLSTPAGTGLFIINEKKVFVAE